MFTARVAIRLLFSHTFSDHAVVSNTTNTRDLYSVARLARCTGYYSSEEIVTSWTQNCREIVLRRRTQTASSPRWISPMPKDTNYTTKMEFLLCLRYEEIRDSWSLGMHHLKRNYLDTLWHPRVKMCLPGLNALWHLLALIPGTSRIG